MRNEEKIPNERRKAAEKGQDSSYLNGKGLEDDLVDPEIEGGGGPIVDSEHPENQEWNAREEQNRGKPQ